MSAVQKCRSLLWIAWLLAGTSPGATPTTLLPGVTYYEGPEKLTENVEQVIPGFISQVYWVGGEAKED